MKAVTIKELKQELNHRSPKEVMDLCLRLTRFKKENKELLTYLLFEASYEEGYINSVKEEIDEQFERVNTKSPYFTRKSIRTILKNTRKYIRYSKNKETEVDLLLYFCAKMKDFRPSIKHNKRLQNLFNNLIESIQKKIITLHEDLQYDYEMEVNNLID
ncbi:MAG: hypothetical protein KAH67_01155 [Flavobacteriaceae bacterium]|nr:hypothetical protein [Flavobacteriaceae bacterium]